MASYTRYEWDTLITNFQHALTHLRTSIYGMHSIYVHRNHYRQPALPPVDLNVYLQTNPSPSTPAPASQPLPKRNMNDTIKIFLSEHYSTSDNTRASIATSQFYNLFMHLNCNSKATTLSFRTITGRLGILMKS